MQIMAFFNAGKFKITSSAQLCPPDSIDITDLSAFTSFSKAINYFRCLLDIFTSLQ